MFFHHPAGAPNSTGFILHLPIMAPHARYHPPASPVKRGATSLFTPRRSLPLKSPIAGGVVRRCCQGWPAEMPRDERAKVAAGETLPRRPGVTTFAVPASFRVEAPEFRPGAAIAC